MPAACSRRGPRLASRRVPDAGDMVRMRIFHCDHCENPVFFENTHCLRCGHLLAFLPDLMEIGSLDPAGEGTWRSPHPAASDRVYRLCANYSGAQVCNWAVEARLDGQAQVEQRVDQPALGRLQLV